VHGDGVLVPCELARPLARLAITGAKMVSDRDGGLVLPPGMATLLAELATFAGEIPARTVGAVPPCTPSAELTVGEAAAVTSLSAQRVRYLARSGRLIARRAGRDWLIDRLAAEDYARRRQVA
jgi:excisionase family DNA binding protein